MNTLNSSLMLLGRILLSAIFILSGIGKILDYENTARYMAGAGITFVPFFLYAAAAVEILAGLMVLIGYHARIGAALLFLFLIPTTLLFHPFWRLEGFEGMIQMAMFMKNLAIMGGLLYVIGTGAGRYSLDSYFNKSV